jgi:hypothetical protein
LARRTRVHILAEVRPGGLAASVAALVRDVISGSLEEGAVNSQAVALPAGHSEVSE